MPSSGLISWNFTGCVHVVSAKFVMGPADLAKAYTFRYFPPRRAAFLQRCSTGAVEPGQPRALGRPPCTNSGEVTSCAAKPSGGGRIPPVNWLGVAFGGSHMPNWAMTGCLISVVMLPIVIEPVVTTPATHPVALPPSDSCIRGRSSGQSVNGL